MKNKFKVLLILSFISAGVSQADTFQNIGGQIEDSPYEQIKDADKGDTPFLSGANKDGALKVNDSDDSIMAPGQASDEWLKSVKGGKSAFISGDNSKYIEHKNTDIVKELHKKSKSAWGFSYYVDTYDYKDRDNIFKRTFDADSADSTQAGYLLLTFKHNYYRGFADLFVQFDGGFSYNTGNGIFSDDGTESRTSINLWLIPLDFMVGTKIHLGRYAGISLAGGPSVAGLLQNRSDREEGDADKDLRQMGYGFAAQGSLDISLSQMFSGYGSYLKRNSEVSDMSISLTARTMSLSNFKSKDIEISGTSYGLGFKFEFL